MDTIGEKRDIKENLSDAGPGAKPAQHRETRGELGKS